LHAYEENRDGFMAGEIEHPKAKHMQSSEPEPDKERKMGNTFKDPVCDMDVTPETAAGTSEYKGQTYYFCSRGCKRSFDKDPEKYIGKGKTGVMESTQKP
jgi:Cu+-exporting ATPase